MIAFDYESYQQGRGSPLILIVPLVLLIVMSYPWRNQVTRTRRILTMIFCVAMLAGTAWLVWWI